ncbi:PEP-CTERM sorting domain-containing protein [Aliiglaciecola sp. 2_MG-2023]|uniref:PEP-CTERM sorting domain-containing protein n=1 Tax=unclassified Aliiglaciecola TaxID=2593648 RepID=UPI0026E386BB|nr:MULTISPECIES: PEP-CTERM sorting domain-containing protein [unclassified Aliiglaciecola]MDO6713122.1 PEP-CTERM sorting domain-containing protein [Aliiglaciecola sp. 2_MG-2023]MDO6754112.1 PEP-CTERM sorting domain-containing protein [Aliiglaciecola sp. 1_MG-2023]
MIKTKKLALASITLSAMLGASAATAAPIFMQGNFLWTQVSDDGTLGNESASPGLIHDATGTGTFDTARGDYLRPGTPFEGFGISSDQFSTVGNRNSSSDSVSQVSITDLSGGAFDNHVRWTGTADNGFFDIIHDFFFDDTDENLNITTTITAISDMTNLAFSRAIDPDPDNYPGGSASTNNERGLDLNNDGDYDDAGELAQTDFISASGVISGLTMGMFTDSDYEHNTGIEGACCSQINPADYLIGGDFAPIAFGFDSSGDNGIGLGFMIGELNAGDSATLNYSYVFGDTVGTVDIPGDDDSTTVPVPATILLFGIGLMGMSMRKRFAK